MGLSSRWTAETTRRLGARYIFRPVIAMITVVLWTAVLIGWIAVTLPFGVGALLLQVPGMVFLTTGAYATCIRPVVAVRDRDILLRNVIRDVVIPWGTLADIDTKYALTLTTTDGQVFKAWAAPAPSRFSAAKATKSDIRTIRWDADELPPPASAHLRADSGQAAILIRRIQDTDHVRDVIRQDKGARPTVLWASPIVATLALSLAATILVLVLA